METNVGTTDKILRMLAAAVLVILYFTQAVTGTAGIVLLVVAGGLLITSLVGFCPLYAILGISTHHPKKVKGDSGLTH